MTSETEIRTAVSKYVGGVGITVFWTYYSDLYHDTLVVATT